MQEAPAAAHLSFVTPSIDAADVRPCGGSRPPAMSGYRTFAIWGAGNIGSRLAAHLLDFRPEKVSEVIVLTRPVRQTLS
jgi:phosphoglycerate dehydrogenase-like enzyme